MKRILTVFFLFLLVYSIRLDYPPQPYFDETRVVPEAIKLSQLSHYHGSSHPLLSKEIIALSIHILGNNPWGWRLPSLIFAAAATALCGYLAFILTDNVSLFWLTSFLLSIDGLWITQARIGLYNSATMFFILATLICWWQGHKKERKRNLLWIIAAICFGFCIAIKWRAFPLILIPLIYYCLTSSKDQPTYLNFRLCINGFLIILATYFSTFLIVPFINGMHWSDIINLQVQIISHVTRNYHFDHPYFSPWYSWPFLTRPIWFYFLRHPHSSDMLLPFQTIEGIMCIGNPMIFMLIIPTIIWLITRLRHPSNALPIIALSGFLLFWLPSGILQYTYFYQFYFALPFIIIAIACMLDQMWISNKKPLRFLAAGALTLILLSYIFFFPLWTTIPIQDSYYRLHLWLPSWI